MQVRVTGAAELEAALKKLPYELQRGMVRSALREGAKVTLERVIAAAPVRDEPGAKRTMRNGRLRGPGYLKSKIALKSLRSRRGQTAPEVGIVFLDDAWYGRAVEAGHAPPGQRARRRRTKGGAVGALFSGLFAREVGGRSTPPRPFVRPAVAATFEAATERTSVALRARLERWAATQLRRAAR